MKHILKYIFLISFLGSSISVQAALIGRLPSSPGGTDYQAAYDNVLDVTWLTNAGLSSFAKWDDQKAWVRGLNSDSYLGVNNWRLATTNRTFVLRDCRSVSEEVCQNNNELGYMFYYNLDGEVSEDKTGDQMIGDVLLSDIQKNYWSNTAVPGPVPQNFAYRFNFQSGLQSLLDKNSSIYGWAVLDGDIGETLVPIPAAIWLFGTVLIGLFGLGKLRNLRITS